MLHPYDGAMALISAHSFSGARLPGTGAGASHGTGTTVGTLIGGAVSVGGDEKSSTSARLRALLVTGRQRGRPERHSMAFSTEVWS